MQPDNMYQSNETQLAGKVNTIDLSQESYSSVSSLTSYAVLLSTANP